MKFKIKGSSNYDIYNNKFLETKNGRVYRLVYKGEAIYDVYHTIGDQGFLTDVGFDYLATEINVNKSWKIHDENPTR